VTCYGSHRRTSRAGRPAGGASPTGFYFRVLENRRVAAGDEIVKVRGWSGAHERRRADCLTLLTPPGHSRAQLERALSIQALPAGWRGSFQALVQQGPGSEGKSGHRVVDPPPAVGGICAPMRVLCRGSSESNSGLHSRCPPTVNAWRRRYPGQFVVRAFVQYGGRTVCASYFLSDPRARALSAKIKQEEKGFLSSTICARA